MGTPETSTTSSTSVGWLPPSRFHKPEAAHNRPHHLRDFLPGWWGHLRVSGVTVEARHLKLAVDLGIWLGALYAPLARDLGA